MKTIKKEKVNIFGHESLAIVTRDLLTGEPYIVRLADDVILAKGEELEPYMSEWVYTMYTGSKYGTGDFILSADTADGPKVICKL